MKAPFLVVLQLLLLHNSTTAWKSITHQPQSGRRRVVALKMVVSSVGEATDLLRDFDARQAMYMKEKNEGLGGGKSATDFVRSIDVDEKLKLRECVKVIAQQASMERDLQPLGGNGRIMLGICGDSVQDSIACLKNWVSNLPLPRGLLHGMDVNGVPIDPSEFGAVFIKYNTGGAITFSQIRKSGKGFDALWKPGDALVERYEGDFRGVYFNVELQDEEFRQFGLLPLILFDDEEEV